MGIIPLSGCPGTFSIGCPVAARVLTLPTECEKLTGMSLSGHTGFDLSFTQDENNIAVNAAANTKAVFNDVKIRGFIIFYLLIFYLVYYFFDCMAVPSSSLSNLLFLPAKTKGVDENKVIVENKTD